MGAWQLITYLNPTVGAIGLMSYWPLYALGYAVVIISNPMA